MAATCGNGYVFDKLLKKKKVDEQFAEVRNRQVQGVTVIVENNDL